MSQNFVAESFQVDFFAALPYKVMCMEESGKLVYTNKKFCERLGYAARELDKLTVFDINPTATQESWANHWKKVKQKGVDSFKSVHQTKKGDFYDVEISAHFFSNNGKEIIASIVNDISESSFYKNLLGHAERMANVGGWKLNLQDGSIVVTENALKMFGQEDANAFLPGAIITQFEETEKLKELLTKVIRNGASYDEILTLKTKGAPKFLRCVTEPIIRKNKIYKVIGTYQDVTVQVLEEKDLETFKEIMENAKDIVYFRNENYQVRYSNKAFQKLIGHNASSVLQKDLQELVPAYEKEKAALTWNNAKAEGRLDWNYHVVIQGRKDTLMQLPILFSIIMKKIYV